MATTDKPTRPTPPTQPPVPEPRPQPPARPSHGDFERNRPDKGRPLTEHVEPDKPWPR